MLSAGSFVVEDDETTPYFDIDDELETDEGPDLTYLSTDTDTDPVPQPGGLTVRRLLDLLRENGVEIGYAILKQAFEKRCQDSGQQFDWPTIVNNQVDYEDADAVVREIMHLSDAVDDLRKDRDEDESGIDKVDYIAGWYAQQEKGRLQAELEEAIRQGRWEDVETLRLHARKKLRQHQVESLDKYARLVKCLLHECRYQASLKE